MELRDAGSLLTKTPLQSPSWLTDIKHTKAPWNHATPWGLYAKGFQETYCLKRLRTNHTAARAVRTPIPEMTEMRLTLPPVPGRLLVRTGGRSPEPNLATGFAYLAICETDKGAEKPLIIMY